MYQPKTISGKEMIADGAYPVFGANGIIGRYDQFNHAEPQLLITCRGATCGSVNVSLPNSWITGNAMVVRPKDDSIDLRYLEYYFRGGIDISVAITGAAQPQITRTNLDPLTIKYPTSVDEQRRIVAALDKAFAGIATATANAQKNLTNARAIFDSHLQSIFSDGGAGWSFSPFEACLQKIKYTQKVQRKDFKEAGQFPIVSQEADFINGYWDNAKDVLRVKTPLVIFGDHTQVLKYIDFDFVLGADGVKLLLPIPALSAKFLLYFLMANPIKSIGYARHYRLLKELNVGFPALPEQTKVNERLDELSQRIDQLQEVYEAKFAALSELKQSLLHKAFAGELT
jgi:type I restriction enzyme, S subunit